MKNYLLIVTLSIISLLANSCEAQPKLPKSMPVDFQLTLTENVTEKRTIYIRTNELIIISGSGMHNHKSEKFTISREDVERIYALLLENKIDEIKQKPKTSWGDEPSSEYQMEIRFSTNYLWLKSNPPQLSVEDQERFDKILKAIYVLVKK